MSELELCVSGTSRQEYSLSDFDQLSSVVDAECQIARFVAMEKASCTKVLT